MRTERSPLQDMAARHAGAVMEAAAKAANYVLSRTADVWLRFNQPRLRGGRLARRLPE